MGNIICYVLDAIHQNLYPIQHSIQGLCYLINFVPVVMIGHTVGELATADFLACFFDEFEALFKSVIKKPSNNGPGDKACQQRYL